MDDFPDWAWHLPANLLTVAVCLGVQSYGREPRDAKGGESGLECFHHALLAQVCNDPVTH